MFFSKKKLGLAFLLALSIVLSGIPFPGNVNVVNATEVQEEVQETTPEETPTEESGEVINYLINQNFDGFEPGTQAANLSGENYTATYGLSYHHNNAVIANKKDLEADAADSDRCLVLTPVTTLDSNQHPIPVQFTLLEEKQLALGEGITGDPYIVVELDVAIKGVTPFTGNSLLRLGGSGVGSCCVTNFYLYTDYISRRTSSSGGTVANELNAYTQGQVAHLKWVVNRETKGVIYYWNGKLVEDNAKAQWTGSETPAFKYLYFNVPVQTLAEGESTDVKMYIDNLKVYTTNYSQLPTPSPTAPPTPAPTATPNPMTFEGYTLGESVNGTAGGGFHWSSSTTSAKVVTKSTVDAEKYSADDYCLAIPNTASDNIFFIIDEAIPYGEDAEGYAVVEFDFAIAGSVVPQFEIWIGEGTWTQSIDRFYLNGTKLTGKYDGNLGTYSENTFHTFKLYVDRDFLNEENAYTDADGNPYHRYGAHTIVIDDKVIIRDKKNWLGQNVQSIRFAIAGTETDTGVVYVDNLKIYTVGEAPEPVATPKPTATPEPTLAPTATLNPMTFDSYVKGQKVAGTAGNGASWSGNTDSSNTGVVVSKLEAGFEGATADDYCLAINTKDVTAAKAGCFQFLLDDHETFAFDTTMTDPTKDIIVEMDLAVSGEDKTSGFGIFIGNNLGNFTRTTVFMMKGGLIGSNWSNSWSSGIKQSTELVKDKFVHLKYVLPNNLADNKASWYLDGELVTDVATTQAYLAKDSDENVINPSAIWGLRFYSIQEEIPMDATLYVDNIQIYQEGIATPAPTAEPTASPAPTPSPTPSPTPMLTECPFIAEATFDNFTIGAGMSGLSGNNWTGSLQCSNYGEYGNVVDKSTVGLATKEGDLCFEFKPVTNINSKNNPKDQTVRNLNFRFTLAKDYQFPIGIEVQEDKYVVYEMDVAVVGKDDKPNGYGIYINGTGNHSIARFKVYKDRIGNVVNPSKETLGNSVSYDQGQFGKLKVVVNRENRQYSYFWNGELIVGNMDSLYNYDSLADNYKPKLESLVHIRFYINSETLAEDVTEDIDSKLYIDNIRVYTLDENPAPIDISNAVVTLTSDEVACNEENPNVASVVVGDTTLAKETDYTVTYEGTTVTITGKGDYTGVATATWTETHTAPAEGEDDKGYCVVEGCGAIINGKYALYGRSLVLNDAIGVVFYMDFTENMDTENTVMKFKYNGKSDEIAFSKAIKKTVKDEETGEEKTYYGFMCEVFASEMNEEITAELYEKGVKLDTYTYSVKNYCDNQLENDEIQAKPETVKLIKATAEYGAMSQLLS